MDQKSNLSLFAQRHWLILGCIIFLSLFPVAIIIVSLLNGDWVNEIRSPVARAFELYPRYLLDETEDAVRFMSNKPFLVFAFKDFRSGLSLWTLVFNLLTLMVYLLTSLAAAWRIGQYISDRNKPKLIVSLVGTVFAVFAFTYMTVIDHCSGATWVGFVSMYGLGFKDFEPYPFYTILVALVGLGLFSWGAFGCSGSVR